MVSLSTLSNTSSEFIRDVLRNNLTTDPKSRPGVDWVFKGMPENRPKNFPFVIIETEMPDRSRDVMGNNDVGADLVFNIEIWANKMYNRDRISDEMSSILFDVNSSNSNGTSLLDEKISVNNIDATDDDVEDMDGNTIRRKFLTVTAGYGGT